VVWGAGEQRNYFRCEREPMEECSPTRVWYRTERESVSLCENVVFSSGEWEYNVRQKLYLSSEVTTV